MVAKAKATLTEALGNYSSKLDDTLITEERSWLGTLLARVSKEVPARPTFNPTWRIRTQDTKFQSWWRKQGKVTIFFDGASKATQGSLMLVRWSTLRISPG